jgi:hypothetical protein
LRRGDLHHVACWIRSSSSGYVLRVIGRYLSGLTRCERSGQNSKDHRRDPYHVVSDYWVDHGECFLLIDLRIVFSSGSFQIRKFADCSSSIFFSDSQVKLFPLVSIGLGFVQIDLELVIRSSV